MVAMAGLASLAGAQAAAGDGWAISSVPAPSFPNGDLSALSCPSTTTCVAVGGYDDSSGYDHTLAEVQDAGGWSIVPTPEIGGLTGVSCPTSTDCIAVGTYDNWLAFASVPLAEQWNGSGWSSLSLPNVNVPPTDGGLQAVSCSSSTACTAVGGSGAEFWDGQDWSSQSIASAPGDVVATLRGVSCTSSTACTAVGSYDDGSGVEQPLAEAWDGSSWSLQTTPIPAGASSARLTAISCVNSSFCKAVGFYFDSSGTEDPLAEMWDGQSWLSETPPNPTTGSDATLTGVSCTRSTSCTAIGTESTSGPSFAESWDGNDWSAETIPTPDETSGNTLDGVSCASSTVCTAVGATSSGGQPLAEGSTGGNWSLQTAVTPDPTLASHLNSVSCWSMTACAAVGSYAEWPPDPEHPTYWPGPWATLAESWDGQRWSIQPSPNPPNLTIYSRDSLDSVSCTSASFCQAGGTFATSGITAGYVERWDGTDWSISSVPSPADSTDVTVGSVSCTSDNACTGVGSYKDSSGNDDMLAETWDGDSWSIQPATTPPDFGSLNALSCTSTTTCMAVGNTAETGAGTTSSPVSQSSLAEQLSGTTWSSVPTTNPADNALTNLNGVSCQPTGDCDAVGSGFADGGVPDGDAESWDGLSWTLQPTPGLPGTTSLTLSDISCASSTACIAVGSDTDSLGYQQALIESWDGSSWTPEPTPVPGGSVGSSLTSVSCTSPTACVALGDLDSDGLGNDPMFAEDYVIGPATPVNTTLPTISGTATQGQTLTETDGAWTQSPTKFTHQWEDCDSYSYSCQPILEATGDSYTLTAADVGDAICVQESASNSAYTGGPVCSAPTTIVQSDSPPTTTTTTTTSATTTSNSTTSTTTTSTSSTTATDTSTTTATTRTTSTICLRCLLLHALAVRGRVEIPALLRHDGYTFTFAAPTSGRLMITWQLTRVGTSRDAQQHRPVRIATAAKAVQTGRTARIKLGLTRAGRRLLAHVIRLRIVVTGVFTPLSGPITVAGEQLSLIR
jgi:hypothetical protein